MTQLSEYHTRILTTLGDPAGSRYTTNQLDEALRSALAEYSSAFPALSTASFTVAATGRVQTVTFLTNFLFFTLVQWPANPDPKLNQVAAFHSAFAGGYPQIHFFWDTPQAGDVINVAYASSHTVLGLDNAWVTSVPPVHDSLLALGAAAHAAIARSTQIAEQMTSRVSNSVQLSSWGSDRLAEFRSGLAQLAISKSSLINQGGWALDRWDRPQDQPQPFF